MLSEVTSFIRFVHSTGGRVLFVLCSFFVFLFFYYFCNWCFCFDSSWRLIKKWGTFGTFGTCGLNLLSHFRQNLVPSEVWLVRRPLRNDASYGNRKLAKHQQQAATWKPTEVPSRPYLQKVSVRRLTWSLYLCVFLFWQTFNSTQHYWSSFCPFVSLFLGVIGFSRFSAPESH